MAASSAPWRTSSTPSTAPPKASTARLPSARSWWAVSKSPASRAARPCSRAISTTWGSSWKFERQTRNPTVATTIIATPKKIKGFRRRRAQAASVSRGATAI